MKRIDRVVALAHTGSVNFFYSICVPHFAAERPQSIRGRRPALLAFGPACLPCVASTEAAAVATSRSRCLCSTNSCDEPCPGWQKRDDGVADGGCRFDNESWRAWHVLEMGKFLLTSNRSKYGKNVPTTATLSSKFQISIPKAVRDQQRWQAGQEFVFIPKGKGVLVMPVHWP